MKKAKNLKLNLLPRTTLRSQPSLCCRTLKSILRGLELHHGLDVLLSLREPIVSKRIKPEHNRGEGENREVSCLFLLLQWC